ncbi:histidine phosphatase superfamily [Fusarium solani]|uniref:Histidine phosphatase superfamily n=1 Tax=Fusarium solani TaxID=169388 RepID=A0A9P9KT43_FUSSL|nr:histidine phosphatase superfamily [Fusarium solani]KAH7267987.1 histidine phosphatase superfamily [Fusarium solani]
MSARDALTPRVFLIRHGETEWAKSGRYTGITDIELTSVGIQQVSSVATTLVGPDKLVDPSRITHVFVSPRKRAKKTFELLQIPSPPTADGEWEVTYTEDIAEWDYGDYEGLMVGEIKELRKARGLDQEKEWNIWRDGCEGGETMQQVTKRLDRLVSEIRNIQMPNMNGEKPANVLLVAHGLILRCFIKRWLGWPIDFSFPMMLDPGAVTVLSYKNSNVDEPALHVGMALPPLEGAHQNES